jgi:subtilase family serine protease
VIRRIALAVLIIAVATAFHHSVFATAGWRGTSARAVITKDIDGRQGVTLLGNTRPEANPVNDRGPVPDDFELKHMLLQLRRPPELQAEYDQYLEGLTLHSSANFHQWLRPTEVGERYGLADSDLKQIELWLRSHGIRVNYVYPNHVVMDISATATELREAMRVSIHYFEVDGEKHFANVNDPEIPEALASAIVGVVSMHDFTPHPMVKPRTQYTYADSNGTFEAVTPADLAEIYNFNPLFSQGIIGTGQTVVVVEDSDPYATTDWATFEQEFKLTQYGGGLSVTHPNVTTPGNCSDPGDTADDLEVGVDMEYAAAAAPGAAINVASCANTATAGPLIALENITASASHPYIISVSYGQCEAANGAAANAAIYSAYQTAASEGISVFVSTGDEGAVSCDANAASASHGINVSGWASTPYNVAVGGTDFGDTVTGTVSTYWSSTNSASLQSAMGYVPEIPWNDSCAGALLATFEAKNPPFGAAGFCNTDGTGFRTTASGSGGPSGCATGAALTGSEVSGTCAGYSKPSWQSGLFGNPDDNVRDLPDVSLFAANGLWGHFYVVCYSHTGSKFGGNPCTGNPDPTASTGATWNGVGGTSFGAPILAGIQALVNQRTAALTITPIPGQGNPNPVYYTIAGSEYGTSGSVLCNSSAQPVPRRGVATTCVFYDVTQGDIDVNCSVGSASCYDPGGTSGRGGNGYNGAISTGTISLLNLSNAGAGYTGDPACTISAPHNPGAYNGYAGGTQATCSATASGGHVTGVTLTNAGAGYAPNPVCTLTGGGGAGAICLASGVTDAAYQPGFPATAGWDFSTGIGTVNAYNLVFSPVWTQGP